MNLYLIGACSGSDITAQTEQSFPDDIFLISGANLGIRATGRTVGTFSVPMAM
jgi:hypothetical protein